MFLRIFTNCIFIDAAEEHYPSLLPPCDWDKSRLLAVSSDSTSMIRSSKEKRLDQRVHRLPPLLWESVEIFPLEKIIGNVAWPYHVHKVGNPFFLPQRHPCLEKPVGMILINSYLGVGEVVSLPQKDHSGPIVIRRSRPPPCSFTINNAEMDKSIHSINNTPHSHVVHCNWIDFLLLGIKRTHPLAGIVVAPEDGAIDDALLVCPPHPHHNIGTPSLRLINPW